MGIFSWQIWFTFQTATTPAPSAEHRIGGCVEPVSI